MPLRQGEKLFSSLFLRLISNCKDTKKIGKRETKNEKWETVRGFQ
jgi:hypothetical protein